MDGLERLIQRIEAESEDQAAKTLEAAQREASSILDSAKQEAEEIKKQLMNQLEAEVKSLRERKVSRAALTARDEVLKAKREALESVYARALQLLEAMGGETLFEFLLSRLQSAVKGGKVVLAMNDQTAGQLPVQYLERLIEVFGREDVKIEIEEERRLIPCGFQLIQGGVVYDFTFPALVSEVRETMEPQLAEQLFKGV